MIDPNLFIENKIPVYRFVQEPGQFVFIFPYSFFAVVDLGVKRLFYFIYLFLFLFFFIFIFKFIFNFLQKKKKKKSLIVPSRLK